MIVLFLLIPMSIGLAAMFLGAFIWAVRSGQFEDTSTPSMRVLMKEPSIQTSRKPGSDSASNTTGV